MRMTFTNKIKRFAVSDKASCPEQKIINLYSGRYVGVGNQKFWFELSMQHCLSCYLLFRITCEKICVKRQPLSIKLFGTLKTKKLTIMFGLELPKLTTSLGALLAKLFSWSEVSKPKSI